MTGELAMLGLQPATQVASTTGVLPVVVTLVQGLLSISLILAFIRLVRGPSLPDRVVALDLIAVLAVGIIAVYDIATEQPVFLDVAIALALVGFLGVVAFARYIEKGATRYSATRPGYDD